MTQRRSSDTVFSNVSSNLQYLCQLAAWLLEGIDFGETRLRSDCSWSAKTLVLAAFIWAWASPTTLLQRFTLAQKIIGRIFPRQDSSRTSYQAFIKLLGRHTSTLLPVIVKRLRRRMTEDLAKSFMVADRAVFAVDGTKVLLPKTKSNQAAYAKTRKRKQKRTDVGAKTKSGHLRNKVPQFYVTLIWNLGTQLMWDWRAGPNMPSRYQFKTKFAPLYGSQPLDVLSQSGICCVFAKGNFCESRWQEKWSIRSWDC